MGHLVLFKTGDRNLGLRISMSAAARLERWTHIRPIPVVQDLQAVTAELSLSRLSRLWKKVFMKC